MSNKNMLEILPKLTDDHWRIILYYFNKRYYPMSLPSTDKLIAKIAFMSRSELKKILAVKSVAWGVVRNIKARNELMEMLK